MIVYCLLPGLIIALFIYATLCTVVGRGEEDGRGKFAEENIQEKQIFNKILLKVLF